MGRKSKRIERRGEILQAFAKVMADHGFAGATITAVADAAGLSPGLLHHHFKNKEEMLSELFSSLLSTFKLRLQTQPHEASDMLFHYVDCALKLDQHADVVMAKCWVGVLSEALREPSLFAKLRSHLQNEVDEITKISHGKIDTGQSSALLAYILGSLVFGAFAPRKTAGFAATNGKLIVNAFMAEQHRR